jgi:hypothetical protein
MNLLSCSLCQGALEGSESSDLVCRACGRVSRRLPDGRWDFRLGPGEQLTYQHHYSPRRYAQALEMPLQIERPSASARNRFDGVVPVHLTPALVSYVPQGHEGEIALDLGCGHGQQRAILEQLGYAVYAVDFDGAAADDLVDAHALPLPDRSIQLVMSIAVLEHLADPLRAVSEVLRVLRPGGYFIGTVAFLEPFHDNSFFHFTHPVLSWALQTNGFEVETSADPSGTCFAHRSRWRSPPTPVECRRQGGVPSAGMGPRRTALETPSRASAGVTPPSPPGTRAVLLLSPEACVTAFNRSTSRKVSS